jgi:hypothetical protein
MMSQSRTRNLGSPGPTVFPLALECTGTFGTYRQTEDDERIAQFPPRSARF